MNFKDVITRYAANMFNREDLPAAASNALEEGYDSPSLRLLAGADASDTEYLHTHFARALEELGIPLPTPKEAGMVEARKIAAQIVEREITPLEGARQMCRINSSCPNLGLDKFAHYLDEVSEYLTCDYGDHPNNREHYFQRIIDSSKEMLDGKS